MSWTETRSLIGHIKKEDPNADTSELLKLMRHQKAQSDIIKLADKVGLTAEERQHVAEMLLASVDG